MKLESPRLLIRDLQRDDWMDVHAYASNPEVTKYMLWGPNSEADTKAYMEEQLEQQQAAERSHYELGVILKDTNTFIGGCSIYPQGSNAEIGYCFNPDFHGNGYATEAAHALLRLGFETLHMHRIYATCRPANIASANVMRRIGMKQEGHLREHLWSKGMHHDSYLFSILEREYDYSKNPGS